MKKTTRKPSTHGGKRKGAGRKPSPGSGERKPTSVLFPPDVLSDVDAFRESRGVTQSRSGAIIDLVKAGLSILK